MDKNIQKELNQINKELKVYINESSFISQKCRNKMLSFFEEEFKVSLDIGRYQNVDLVILDDFTISYRDDVYIPDEVISSLEDLKEKYHRFQEKADHLIKKKEIDFDSKRNFNHLINLLFVILIFLAAIGIFLLGVIAFLRGNYFDCLWFLFVIVPIIVPKFKNSLQNRIIMAKDYLRSIRKKFK